MRSRRHGEKISSSAYERLRKSAGFEDYESFVSAHRMWVQAALEEIDAKQQSRWTKSIAVRGSPFIEHIKKAMGAMAKGRCLQPGEGAFELREAQSVYNAIFDHENRDIDPNRPSFSNFFINFLIVSLARPLSPSLPRWVR